VRQIVTIILNTKSVGPHMYQLHYHHPYYVSLTVSFKKKYMKQTYYFHPKHPNKSQSNASQCNCNPAFQNTCKSLCPYLSTAPHGKWSEWREKRSRHSKNQWSKTEHVQF